MRKKSKFQTAATTLQRRFSNSLLIAEMSLNVNALGFILKPIGFQTGFITGKGGYSLPV